jgi:hypothetical protein
MSREAHVRFWESAGVRFPRATRLSEGLQRSSRRCPESWTVLQVLQWTAAASSIELSNAGRCVLRREEAKDARTSDRLRCRSSFIGHPDAKIFHAPRNVRKDAASRRLLLMSFEGMRKSIRTIEAPTHKADASAHLSDEFPAGYSLMRCSPAVLVSALPAGVDYASGLIQVRGIFNNERSRTEKRNEIHRQRSTLRSPFFCPKNGETLRLNTLGMSTGRQQYRFLFGTFTQ